MSQLDAVVSHYKPGNIIYSAYWQSYDKVISFKQDKPNSWNWEVQVVKVDPITLEELGKPRWHMTRPDFNLGDKVIKQLNN